jgi:electron transport complex protein RnfC
VQYYRYAKTEIWNLERQRKLSDLSRERFEFRKLRLEREKQERAMRHKQKRMDIDGESSDAEQKKAQIQAAMERARAKRESSGVAPKNVDNLTEQQKQLIAEADARRAAKKQVPPTEQAS